VLLAADWVYATWVSPTTSVSLGVGAPGNGTYLEVDVPHCFPKGHGSTEPRIEVSYNDTAIVVDAFIERY
jgi:hypothetical protein